MNGNKPLPSYDSVVHNLESSDEETRRLAVQALASFCLTAAHDQLFRAMGDSSWRVRKEAVAVFLAAPDAVQFIEGVFSLIRCADNAGLRNSAAEVLEKFGSDALPFLHVRLDDVDRDVRKFVIDILGGIGAAASTSYLVTALTDRDPNVRSAAAESLGKIASAVAVDHLIAALAVEDVTFRHTILVALGRIGAPVQLETVRPFLADPFLRKAVYECLGTTGGADALATLIAGLAETAKAARESAVRALVVLVDRLWPAGFDKACGARLRHYAGTPVVAGLLSLLESADDGLREGLIRVLGSTADSRAAAVILRACRNERLFPECLKALRQFLDVNGAFLAEEFCTAEDGERAMILHICGELETFQQDELMGKGLADPAPQVREAAVRAVGRIGLTALISEVAGLLRDFDLAVRQAALETLAQLAGRKAAAIQPIAVALAAGDAGNRRDAADLFGALGDRHQLALLLKDEDDQVRRHAVRGIANLQGDDVVHLLSLAFTDEIADVRMAAASALGETGKQEALAPLLLALTDTDPWVCCAAVRSLGVLGGDTALAAIGHALAATDQLIAIAALEALGRFPAVLARDFVRKAVVSANSDMVRVAVEILAGWDDPWLAEHAEQFLTHSHWGVRGAVVQFLGRCRGAAAVPLLCRALEREDDDLVRMRISEFLERFRC
jgi:HEAT repeat protein